MSSQTDALYRLPERGKPYRQLARLLAVYLAFILLLNAGLSSWGAHSMAQLAGRWFQELGQPLLWVGGLPVMPPWAWFMWDARLGDVQQFQRVLAVIQLASAAGALAVFPLRVLIRPEYHNADVHGSARFATKAEIVKMGLLQEGE